MRLGRAAWTAPDFALRSSGCSADDDKARLGRTMIVKKDVG